MEDARADELSLARLFGLALDLLCVAGTDGYFRRVNPAFQRTLGWPDEQLLSVPFLDLVHPEDVDATLRAMATLAGREAVVDFENRYRCADGTYRWLAWRSAPSEDGQLIYACARDVTAEKQAMAVAHERAEIIERQSKDLEQAARAHRTLTQAVADGAGTPEVLRLVSALTGKPTALLSGSFNLLQVVTTDASADLPATRALGSASRPVKRLLAVLDESKPSAILPPLPQAGVTVRHLVGRLVARGQPLGYLAVAEVGSPLSPFDVQVVEHSATVLSLEVVAHQRQEQAEGQGREDFLSDLLQGGRDREWLLTRACAYDVHLERTHVLVRIAYDATPRAPITGAARRAYVARQVGEHLGEAGVLSVGVPGADVVLCPLPPGERRQALERVRAAVARSLQSAGVSRHVRGAVVSVPCTEPEHYADAHRELRLILETVAVRPEGGVVLAGDLGVLRVVVSSGDGAAANRFSAELLAPLVEHDERGGGELVPTLRSFLDCGGRFRETAKALGVHENTVRYRLHQVKKLAGIDPDDLGSLLDARFALQALALGSRPAAEATDGSW